MEVNGDVEVGFVICCEWILSAGGFYFRFIFIFVFGVSVWYIGELRVLESSFGDGSLNFLRYGGIGDRVIRWGGGWD